MSFAHEFLTKGDRSAEVKLKRKAEDEGDNQRLAKKVCLTREQPKFGVAMGKHMETLAADMQKAMNQAKKAVAVIEKANVALTDKPSHLFKSTLQFRMQLAFRWSNDINTVVMIGMAAKSGGGDAPPSNAASGESTAQDPVCKAAGPASTPPPPTEPVQASAVQPCPADVAEGPELKKDPHQTVKEEVTPKKLPCKDRDAAGSPAPSEASMQVVFANAEPSAVADYKVRIRRQSTLQLLTSNPHKKPFDADPATFMTESEMKKEMQRILELTTPEDFVKARDAWTATVATIKEFTKNLTRASSDIMGHVKSLETKAKTEKEKTEKELQRQDVAKAREDAKKAADDIRKNMRNAAPQAQLFELDFEKAGVAAIAKFEGQGHLNEKPDLPFILAKYDRQKLWMANETVDKALAAYGNSYKKSKDVKAQGRGQAPLLDTAARDETMEFLMSIVPSGSKVLDISDAVQNGKTFVETCWFYGFMPGNVSFSMPPNGAAFVKSQVLGTTTVVLMQLASLVSYLNQNSADGVENGPVFQTVCQWGEKEIQAAMGNEADGKVEMLQGSMAANESLFVPSGWVMLERAGKDQTAVYGVRKSMFIDSSENKRGYKAMRDYYASEKRDVGRMDTILSLYENAD